MFIARNYESDSDLSPMSYFEDIFIKIFIFLLDYLRVHLAIAW